MHIIKNIYRFVTERKIPTLAGSLSFFLILNGGSFLFLYIIISSVLPYSFNEFFLDQIEEGKFKEFVTYFFNYQNSLPYSIFLIATSIYSASSLYYHWLHITEMVRQEKSSFSLSKRISAVILTVLFLLLVHLITFISTLLMLRFSSMYLVILAFTFLFLFLFIIYTANVVAFQDFHLKRIYKGVLFSFFYYLFFSIGFFIYLRLFSNFKIVYGVLSFFIIIFFYIYISCIGMILGIYLNCKNLDVWKLFQKTE